MRITDEHHNRETTIADAVQVVCDGSDYDRGELETLRAGLEQTARLLGEMVEALADAGMSHEMVSKLLGYRFKVEP